MYLHIISKRVIKIYGTDLRDNMVNQSTSFKVTEDQGKSKPSSPL